MQEERTVKCSYQGLPFPIILKLKICTTSCFIFLKAFKRTGTHSLLFFLLCTPGNSPFFFFHHPDRYLYETLEEEILSVIRSACMSNFFLILFGEIYFSLSSLFYFYFILNIRIRILMLVFENVGIFRKAAYINMCAPGVSSNWVNNGFLVFTLSWMMWNRVPCLCACEGVLTLPGLEKVRLEKYSEKADDIGLHYLKNIHSFFCTITAISLERMS